MLFCAVEIMGFNALVQQLRSVHLFLETVPLLFRMTKDLSVNCEFTTKVLILKQVL